MDNFDSNASDPMNQGGGLGDAGMPADPQQLAGGYPQEQFQPQMAGGLDGGMVGAGGIQYSLDASMSPEGRREFGV